MAQVRKFALLWASMTFCFVIVSPLFFLFTQAISDDDAIFWKKGASMYERVYGGIPPWLLIVGCMAFACCLTVYMLWTEAQDKVRANRPTSSV